MGERGERREGHRREGWGGGTTRERREAGVAGKIGREKSVYSGKCMKEGRAEGTNVRVNSWRERKTNTHNVKTETRRSGRGDGG